ncbi:MAG: hypothetical protein WA322_21360 [Pseudolabrys sp.]
MKSLVATAIFLILTVVAVAKPAPVSDFNPSEDRTPALARNDADINIGSTGATLERYYFQASQIPFVAGRLPCRSQSVIFDKVYLARSCR